eukprot:TRINITY_DN34549_c0_g1_i2.p1 TRINITY_DN34549_c0_g1~~TRINITY_DN34549_c0_g1_i2.p1  ORF type:complete len:243 (+),score=49.33 TRINITY_DN34549_c0_g1_i2:103-831(+)
MPSSIRNAAADTSDAFPAAAADVVDFAALGALRSRAPSRAGSFLAGPVDCITSRLEPDAVPGRSLRSAFSWIDQVFGGKSTGGSVDPSTSESPGKGDSSQSGGWKTPHAAGAEDLVQQLAASSRAENAGQPFGSVVVGQPQGPPKVHGPPKEPAVMHQKVERDIADHMPPKKESPQKKIRELLEQSAAGGATDRLDEEEAEGIENNPDDLPLPPHVEDTGRIVELPDRNPNVRSKDSWNAFS